MTFCAYLRAGRDSEVIAVSEYNVEVVHRSVKYSHPETLPDDAMHATNYALQVAIYMFPSNRELRMFYG